MWCPCNEGHRSECSLTLQPHIMSFEERISVVRLRIQDLWISSSHSWRNTRIISAHLFLFASASRENKLKKKTNAKALKSRVGGKQKHRLPSSALLHFPPLLPMHRYMFFTCSCFSPQISFVFTKYSLSDITSRARRQKPPLSFNSPLQMYLIKSTFFKDILRRMKRMLQFFSSQKRCLFVEL